MNPRRCSTILVVTVLAFAILSFPCPVAGQPADAQPTRPAEWAQPLQRPGLPNLHRVSEVLFRGAQPTAEGMRSLEQLGVRTVVNLRRLHSDRDELEGTNLRYVHIPINTWHLKSEHVLQFLQVVADSKNHPVFVHCQHGADRTGTMVAFYRMVYQSWPKTEAVREMTEGAFGYHSVWRNLLKFIDRADIADYRRQLGLGGSAPGAR